VRIVKIDDDDDTCAVFLIGRGSLCEESDVVALVVALEDKNKL